MDKKSQGCLQFKLKIALDEANEMNDVNCFQQDGHSNLMPSAAGTGKLVNTNCKLFVKVIGDIEIKWL